MHAKGWAAVVLLLLLPAPTLAQQGSVVTVVAQEVEGDSVNLTVSATSRPGEIRVAGLYVDGALASSQATSVWVDTVLTSTLHFTTRSSAREVELRLTVIHYSGNSETVVTDSLRLLLAGAADIRPVRTSAGGGNVTFDLRNFGDGTARDLLVSLLDDADAPISDPYYQQVGQLDGGATRSVSFRVTGAVDRASLLVETPHGKAKFPVRLTATGGASLRVEADTPSLQAAPGGKADYSIRLRNHGPERVVELAVEGLPDAFATTFAVGGAVTQSIRLSAGETKSVALAVTVPSTYASNKTGLPFKVVARSDASRFEAPLTLVVAGQPRIDLVGRNWFVSTQERSHETAISVKNTGSAAAFDVALTATAPPGWDARFTPARIGRLGPGEEATVQLRLTAPEGTGDGRYVIDIGAQGGGAVARERSLSLELSSPPPSKVPWMVGAAAVVGAALFLVARIRRK